MWWLGLYGSFCLFYLMRWDIARQTGDLVTLALVCFLTSGCFFTASIYIGMTRALLVLPASFAMAVFGASVLIAVFGDPTHRVGADRLWTGAMRISAASS